MLQRESGLNFIKRIVNLLERTEYRRADTWEEKEPLYRLRYEAYSREGYIGESERRLFHDGEDEVANVWLIGLYIDGELAGTSRLHVASRPEHFLPVAARFPDEIEPRLRAGQTVIDTTRLSTRLEFSRAYPFLPYLMMRATFIAADYFAADWMLAAMRTDYQGAYRRMWGAKRLAGPIPYPPLAKPHVMMGYEYASQRAVTRSRYPFLDSTEAEQRALFGCSSTGARHLYEELSGSRRLHGAMQHATVCLA